MQTVTHIYIRPDRDGTLIDRALRSAARRGVDPRNSHEVQSRTWRDAWARRESRAAMESAMRAGGSVQVRR